MSYFPHEADLKLANRVASGDRVDPGDSRQNDVGLAVGIGDPEEKLVDFLLYKIALKY